MPAWIGRGCVKYLIRAESSLRETIDGRPTNPSPPPPRAYPPPLPSLLPPLSPSSPALLPPSFCLPTMTRGAIMSTSFQDSFTPSFESYRKLLVSLLPTPFHPSLFLSLCAFNEIVLCAVTLLFFLLLGYPPCPLILPPVIFLVSLLLFFSSFFSFCKSSLSFSPFLSFFSFRVFLFTQLFRGITLTSLLSWRAFVYSPGLCAPYVLERITIFFISPLTASADAAPL